MKKVLGFVGLAGFAPMVVSAQASATSILDTVKTILDTIIPILITLAIVYFFWGLAKFILAAGDPAAQAEGKSVMIWGVIALFVIVSVWGLVSVIQETFQTTDTASVTSVPNFPTVQQ